MGEFAGKKFRQRIVFSADFDIMKRVMKMNEMKNVEVMKEWIYLSKQVMKNLIIEYVQ